MVERKTCSICREEKDLINFVKDSSRKGKHSYQCKACANRRGRDYYARTKAQWQERHLKQTYGLSLEDVEAKLYHQNHLCPCCKTKILLYGEKENKPVVDHCHKTSKIRDMLCNNCNKVLGLVKERTETLDNMIKYLDKWHD